MEHNKEIYKMSILLGSLTADSGTVSKKIDDILNDIQEHSDAFKKIVHILEKRKQGN